MKIEKLSSIPGRIRIGIEGLKGNPNLALYIENLSDKFPSIQSITINTKTGNVLVTYKPYTIDEAILLKFLYKSYISSNNSNSITYEGTKSSSGDLFKEEISLSRKLLALSIAAASILFFTSSPANPIASLILGFPGVIYFTSYLSLKYTLNRASSNNVYIKNTDTIRFIKNIKSVSIHPNVVFNNFKLKKFGSINSFRIESLISTGAAEDPINSEVRILVRDLRYMGINNINIISKDEKKEMLLYANKSLGLYDVQRDMEHEMIITNENDVDSIEATKNKIILCLSSSKSFHKQSININPNELHKIRWLIEICIGNQEYLTRSLAACVSINLFGIVCVIMRYISLSGSIMIYFVNSLGNAIYLKHKLSPYNREELLYGEESDFRNT